MHICKYVLYECGQQNFKIHHLVKGIDALQQVVVILYQTTANWSALMGILYIYICIYLYGMHSHCYTLVTRNANKLCMCKHRRQLSSKFKVQSQWNEQSLLLTLCTALFSWLHHDSELNFKHICSIHSGLSISIASITMQIVLLREILVVYECILIMITN